MLPVVPVSSFKHCKKILDQFLHQRLLKDHQITPTDGAGIGVLKKKLTPPTARVANFHKCTLVLQVLKVSNCNLGYIKF